MSKRAFIAFWTTLVFCLLLPAATAAPIPGLFNTGVDDTGALLPDGATDTHYGVVAAWIAGPRGVNDSWVSNASSLASRWIMPNPMPCCSTSDTVYSISLTFDLTGYDSTSASLSGRWATDNFGDVYLNGALLTLGHSPSAGDPLTGFSQWSPFAASSGFVAGLNTLSFRVVNSGSTGFDTDNPTGLRVEFLSSSVSAVPETSTYLMLFAGLAVLACVTRRKGTKTGLL
jgi:hypothetical protein